MPAISLSPVRTPGLLLAGLAGSTALLLAAPAGASPRPQANPGSSASPANFSQRDFSGVRRLELAGHPLDLYPHFEFVRTFMEGESIDVAVDPTRHPEITGFSGDLYVVAHRDLGEWQQSDVLQDVRGAPQPVLLIGPGIQGDRIPVEGAASLSGDAGIGLGVPYDVVLDADGDGRLGDGDWMDGLDGEPGFFVAAPTQVAGPLAVTEVLYSGGTWLGQDLYYPTDVATLGELPLVVVSHGNGHNYQWYDHIGYHLASYGCVVMSHQNNTQPGIETASTTTLTNTDYLLSHLDTIAGGVLDGHVDGHRIVWIGHSRGGEGVVRAYDRVFDGDFVPASFGLSDIVLVSSIAPTDFLGPVSTDPHEVNYHLWVGAADNDVSGCADCPQCQSFRLLDRATGNRQAIDLHGVGHGAFHNGAGGTVAAGPCQVSRADTHQLMRAYLVPLVKRYTEGNLAAEDFLWRSWERFHSPGVPEGPCVVIDLQYNPAAASDRFVVDDFQSEPSTTVSSSGGAVESDFTDLLEDRLDELDTTFTYDGTPMNGMTLGGPNDTTRGITFGWEGADSGLRFALPGGGFDLTPYRYVSFRACQLTRDPLNVPWFGDQLLEVGVHDGQGNASFIPISAYGSGIQLPYQRTGCGTGVGWSNEMETIRIRLEDFTRDGAAVDLTDAAWIEIRCGPVHGTKTGRLGFDDLQLLKE